ncbi:uncharacterized protein PHALS_15225 [Plasmopara halstedii]|uniref:Uncharacterized protein n=1 Tax=Plasmopara halstedii TaxID=4781 RepID=A0A0P1B574_PLAHL|nr:uncharacterized protein PHALS_15225 [Plasmopara halstedii]CEG49648.1 hypothetical protein PHALS_15225 [Plasmopara halstedii]|eukprot:XP_024586017.1 hypothetical protein PHALS_15225 [Plasmopara halstedii]
MSAGRIEVLHLNDCNNFLMTLKHTLKVKARLQLISNDFFVDIEFALFSPYRRMNYLHFTIDFEVIVLIYEL